MAGRVDVAARIRRREAHGVLDRPGEDFVVADETGEDRQTRRVGAGPARGPERVRMEVEGGPDPADHARARLVAAYSSDSLHCPRSSEDMWCPIPASIRGLDGIGYGSGSDSSAYSKLTL